MGVIPGWTRVFAQRQRSQQQHRDGEQFAADMAALDQLMALMCTAIDCGATAPEFPPHWRTELAIMEALAQLLPMDDLASDLIALWRHQRQAVPA